MTTTFTESQIDVELVFVFLALVYDKHLKEPEVPLEIDKLRPLLRARSIAE
jgi:hypothetical protein